jgi:hypothetical protein
VAASAALPLGTVLPCTGRVSFAKAAASTMMAATTRKLPEGFASIRNRLVFIHARMSQILRKSSDYHYQPLHKPESYNLIFGIQ